MSLLDYYRQFEEQSPSEINESLREQAADRAGSALERIETLDLSQTTWPELPDIAVVNAITFAARSTLQRYPYTSATALRGELAERHGIDSSRLIIGNGSAALLSAAVRAFIEPGGALLTRSPVYHLYPTMAQHAHGHAIPVRGGVRELLAAAEAQPAVRAIVLASPDDPTGELLMRGELEWLLRELRDDVVVLLDESLVDFAEGQPASSSLTLLDDHPGLIVFRSFSKAWGLAGLRIGYAVGGPNSGALLAELEPDLGVSELSQAGALAALHSSSALVERRVRAVGDERTRVSAALRARGFELSDSQANFVWAAHPVLDGVELATRLAQAGVLVAVGRAMGEPRHVRISLRSRGASDRLLRAIDEALSGRPEPTVAK